MRSTRRVLVGAVTAPVLFAGSALVPVALRAARRQTVGGMEPATALALASVGGLAGGAHAAGARLAPAWMAVGLALLVLPGTGPVDAPPGYVLPVFVGVAALAAVELLARDPGRLRRALRADDVRLGLAVGCLYLVVALGGWVVARGPPRSPSSLWLLVWTGSALGLVATGAIPVVALRRWRLRLPAVALVGWLAWAAVGLRGMRGDLPLTAFQAIRWSGVPPFPDYAVSWATLLVVLVTVGYVEWTVRRRLGR